MHHRIPPLLQSHTFLAALGTALLLASASGQDEASLAGKAVVLPVSTFSLIEAAQTDYLKDTLERARREGAAAVILEIDSPGGLAISTRQLVEKLGEMGDVATYALIEGQAVGGAALLALAADKIYFHPDSEMGSSKAAPIDWRGKKNALPDRLVDKTYADYSEAIKGIVTAKGRDASLVDGFIDPETEVKLDGQLLSERDDVLVLGPTARSLRGRSLRATSS